jgi:transcriptional regulator GlxA family with amidase domain
VALALVEEDLGRSMALAVARYMVVFLKRPGGQAQFSATLALQAADDKFGALHGWINRHLSDDLSLSILADRAGMSERSFSRHYAQATRQTPARAIERLRVEAARHLLSEANKSVNEALNGWTPRTLPVDWAQYRLQWEIGHAITAALAIAAFLATGAAALAHKRQD